MKYNLRILLLFMAVVAIVSLAGCAPMRSGGLVVGDSYRLESGQTLNNDLTVIGGNALVEEDAIVNGDVAVIGGNVRIDGRINGEISVLGGNVNLGDTAVVQGDVNTIGGSVQRSPQAVVHGEQVGDRPGRITTMRTPGVTVSFDPITGPLMAIFQALAVGALALLVNLFAAPQMDRTGRTALAQPIISGGVGLLTIIVAPALLIIIGITIILLPVSLLGLLALGIAGLFGWLSLGLILGRQIAIWLKQPWSDPIHAGAGTLTLSLISSMLNLVPCIGWLANLLIGLIGLGAVLLTRFGTRDYTSGPGAELPAGPAPTPYNPPPPVMIREPGQGGARMYNAPQSGEDTDLPPSRPDRME
jgi:hypothetical protein